MKTVENLEKTTSVNDKLPDSLELEKGKAIPLPTTAKVTSDANNIAQFEEGFVVAKNLGTTKLHVTYQNLTKDITLSVKENVTGEFEILRQTWVDIISGEQFYSKDSSYMNELFKKNETDVKNFIEEYQKDPSTEYIWKEMKDYTKSPNLTKTYRRLEQMAKAVVTKGSAYYHDATMVQFIRQSLLWLNKNVYNENKEIVQNWWDYEIGTPRALNNILAILEKYFTQDEIKLLLKAIDKFVPEPNKIMVTLNRAKVAVGGNLSDLGKVKIIQAILEKDAQKLETAIKAASQVLTLVDKGEGFYEDGSYIDHTNVAYTGAYGNVLIDGFSQLLPVIQKSSYKIPKEQLNILYQWIHQGFLPMIYKGELMDMTRGRSASRKTQEGHFAAVEVLRGILRIAQASEPKEKNELQGIVKDIVQSDHYFDTVSALKSYYDIYLLEQTLRDSKVSSLNRLQYLKLYNQMDKVAYFNKNRDFAFSISMHSNKTLNYEFMNKENAKGWYTSDGMIYLYNSDQSHYSNDYWATVDPYYLPGTTELLENRENGSGMGVMKSSFVGGTQLSNRYATVGMDFENWNHLLKMKKAWFILGDKVVFLGAPLENTSDKEVYTTIENRKIEDSSMNRSTNKQTQIWINGEKFSDNQQEVQKVHSVFIEGKDTKENIGYQFLDSPTLAISKEHRKGTWKDINNSQSDSEVQNDFIKIVQKHHEQASTYAYILRPNRTAEEFKQELKENEVEILKNAPDSQMIMDKKLNVLGIVKYSKEPEVLKNGVTLLAPGMYTIHKEGSRYEVSYYSPEHAVKSHKEILQASKDMKLVHEEQATNSDLSWYLTFEVANQEVENVTPETTTVESTHEVGESANQEALPEGIIPAEHTEMTTTEEMNQSTETPNLASSEVNTTSEDSNAMAGDNHQRDQSLDSTATHHMNQGRRGSTKVLPNTGTTSQWYLQLWGALAFIVSAKFIKKTFTKRKN